MPVDHATMPAAFQETTMGVVMSIDSNSWTGEYILLPCYIRSSFQNHRYYIAALCTTLLRLTLLLTAEVCLMLQGLPPAPAKKKSLLQKFGTGETVAPALRKLIRCSRLAQTVLLLLVLMMTAMVIGDGVLTPAQTGDFMQAYQ